jgi:hypothetical protein
MINKSKTGSRLRLLKGLRSETEKLSVTKAAIIAGMCLIKGQILESNCLGFIQLPQVLYASFWVSILVE